MKFSTSLTEAINELDEAKGFPPGTVRKRKDGYYVKTHRGDWERSKKGSDPQARGKRQQEVAQTKSTVSEFQKKHSDGAFDRMSFGQHVRVAKDFLGRHNANLARFTGDLGKLAGPTGKVKARTKKLESALGKMVRKPKYDRADKLQDGTGARVVHQSIGQVKDTVAKLREKYRVIEEDNYIDNPHPGDPTYRSHHLIVEDEDGLQKEIQVRTANQDKFADWSHDVYKPTSKLQDELVKKHKTVIGAYARAYSEHFFSVDSGSDSPLPKPECPDEVRMSVGCIG